ncbi:hypothetical protein [Streptomyces jumonjinensis]|uniref:hypothetical protein n=1 Tax=Streptomyces jumonjinensis TaxID=1945 RepID=UPI001E4747C3|nr:hypothetical protein [Streptomyces jumonjinensis]
MSYRKASGGASDGASGKRTGKGADQQAGKQTGKTGKGSGQQTGTASGERAGRPKQRSRTGPRRTGRRPAGRPSLRGALRREVVGTVAVLADASDFALMRRRYRTFAFDDHPEYLRQVEALLKSLAVRQLHTTLALFDPEDFAAYCTQHALDPDSALSRSRYTAEITDLGVTLPYAGEPLDSLLPELIDTAVRRATWEYATALLTGIGQCAECGEDIGRAALDRASHLLTRLLEAAGPGRHHVVCSVHAPEERLLAVLHADGDSPPDSLVDAAEGAQFVAVMAIAIALGRPGGLVLRTSTAGAPDRLHGWRLQKSGLIPLTEGEVFSAYCTDATTGEPLSPEPGVEYRAGFDIAADTPDSHH